MLQPEPWGHAALPGCPGHADVHYTFFQEKKDSLLMPQASSHKIPAKTSSCLSNRRETSPAVIAVLCLCPRLLRPVPSACSGAIWVTLLPKHAPLHPTQTGPTINNSGGSKSSN